MRKFTFFFLDANQSMMHNNFIIRRELKMGIVYLKYWLKRHLKTMYDNNSPDAVGLLAELELAGNQNTELIVFEPDDIKSQKKNSDSIWEAINKKELMLWIKKQSE